MKFSVKGLSLLALALSMSTLANTALPGERVPESRRYHGLSLGKLEKLEMDRPKDPALKEALTHAYWCSGKTSLAVSYSQWLQSLAPPTQRAQWYRVEAFLLGQYQRQPKALPPCSIFPR